jgi:hypothetical protein
MRAEVAAVVPDRELAAKIAQQVVEAFARGMAQGEANRAAAADEPEPEGVFATIRTIGPGDERARRLRWIDSAVQIIRRELGEVLEVAPAPAARGARVGGRTGYRGRRLELPVPRDLELDARLRRLGVRAVGRR